jgi:hypothetical protein
MAFLKKQAAPVAEFSVPRLAEASPEYAALLDKRQQLSLQQSELSAERRELIRKIEEAPAPTMRPGVAALLGETSDSTTVLRSRLSEVQRTLQDIEAALEVVRQRLAVARTGASKSICLQTKPEYGRRVAAICEALEVVAAARAHYDDLRNELERQDVAWASLVPMSPSFLGDARDGHIQSYLREAREAGYYG